MASMRSAYLASTSFRLSFIVGVSSSSSALSCVSRSQNFLICSTRANLALTRSTSAGDQRLHLGRARQARVVAERDVVVLGEFLDVLQIDHDDGGQVGAAVADDDGVGDVGRELELVLELARRDVLATGGDDDVLHAIGDPEIPVAVLRADVAGVQPAVGVDRLGRLLGLVQVAHEDVLAADQQLAGRRVELHLVVRARRADHPRLDPRRRRVGRRTAALGHSPDLDHRHAEGEVPADEVGRDRRRTGDEEARPVDADQLPDVVEREAPRQRELPLQRRADRLAGEDAIGDPAADADRPGVGRLLRRDPIRARR